MQQMYQIEKNVPIPKITFGRPESDLKKMAREMQGGGSVRFLKRNEAMYFGALIRATGFKAVFRTLVDEPGFRVWKMPLEKKGKK